MPTSIEALVDRQLNKLSLRQRTESPLPEVPTGDQPGFRVITVSRQAGSGGRELANRLATSMGFESVDRQILDYIVQNTHARERLIDSLDEKTRSGVDLWVEGLLGGRYVDKSEYTQWLIKSVSMMAEHGDAVILGRAANIILGDRGGLHVRVVAPQEVRIENLTKHRGMSTDEARRHIEDLDKQRRNFYREDFEADIDNPKDYDLIINTGRVSLANAEAIILDLWRRKTESRD